jgi:hypothetical protein
MKAWLGEQLITVEGTPEEWAKFLERLFYAYKYYPGEALMRQLFIDTVKQYPLKQENPTKRNWMPDLEWYDKH